MSTLSGSPNILLLIADDLGEDVVEVGRLFLDQARQTAPMRLTPKKIRVVTYDDTVQIIGELPNLSRFLRNGVYFEQAWAQPSCSPTRASIYTGLHPWKSGVGNPGVIGDPPPKLDPSVSFTTLPELLPSKYVSGLFGKWHLGKRDGSRPTDHGWDKHVGTLEGRLNVLLEGPNVPPQMAGEKGDYTHWEMVDSDNNYTLTYTESHATWVTVKEAAAWINAQDPETPWFATIAFHAPHDPFDVPPFEVGYDTSTAGDSSSDAYGYNVLTQNMDHHIGRLIGTVSGGWAGAFDFDPIPQAQLRNTVIIFVGDNGSPEEVAVEEKKTLIYEGSVRIPMIIADGQAVVNDINSEAIAPRFLHVSRLDTENEQMVHAVDLYMTIARLADSSSGSPSNSDSKDARSMFTSMLPPTAPRVAGSVEPGDLDQLPGFPWSPVRHYNFSQWYTNTEERATLRNSSYKLNYDAADSPVYSLYRYETGEIPGREAKAEVDETATNLYDAAASGADTEAHDNLNELLDELIRNYKPNMVSDFPDPRPFPE